MPQELQVLQCYKCHTYQGHIVKKEPKFVCKICMEKQSVKKIIFSGSGRECRQIVQDLNKERIIKETEIDSSRNYEQIDAANTGHNYDIQDKTFDYCKYDIAYEEEPNINKCSEFAKEVNIEHTEDSKLLFEKPNMQMKRKITSLQHKTYEKPASNHKKSKWEIFLKQDE